MLEGDQVIHTLESPIDAPLVRGLVDGARRADHMQQHHGQHLLSRAFLDLAGARTVSFHLGRDAVSIDLAKEVSEDDVVNAEDATNAVIRAGRPVLSRVVSPEEARRLGVEPPPDATDGVRLVEAEDFDLQPCGGTHPRRTSEVGVVAVLGHERYKGGTRVRFVCGGRVLAALRVRNRALSRLSALFSSPLEQLPQAAEKALLDLEAAERRARELREQSIDAEAGRLEAGAAPGKAIVSIYDGWGADELRELAQRLVKRTRCVALLASRGEKTRLAFAQSEGLPYDIPGLLKSAAAAIGGRGGGKGDFAQGVGEAAGGLEEAIRAAESLVRGA